MADNKNRYFAAAILDDMFFASKLREAAKTAGADIDFIRQPDGIIEKLSSSPPSLLIIDLGFKKIDAIGLIRKIRNTEVLKGVRAIGYIPHVEKELKKKASEAGFDIVLPRSRFSACAGEMLSDFSHGRSGAGKTGQ